MIALLRRSFPFSLRLQVAAWYTIAFAILLLLTGALFYKYLESSLEASVDTDLQIRAQQIASDLVIQNGTLRFHDVVGDLPGFGTPLQQSAPQAVDVNAGALVRLADAQGKILGETSAFHTLHVPGISITQPLHGEPWQGTVIAEKDTEVRLYSRTLTSQGKPLAVIQVGQSLEHLHSLLHRLVAALLAVGFLVLLIAAAGSYWLAARSFAPMQRLAATARKIQAGDLHQRIQVPPVRDEMQYLAITLNEMLESLEESFSRQRRFVADASHELRTPVAVIRNKAGIALLDTPQLDEAVTVLQEIHSETERLSLLLNDLLTLAKGDEGQARFEHEVVQLDVLVETVAATTEVLAQERNIQVEVQAPQPVTLIGDEARLIQVVMNLLDNAIRYTNPGGHIWIAVDQTASTASLTVRDTGIGMTPEHSARIFERFYRVDPARERTSNNSNGLGLAIVDWIVRTHGGSIQVESQPGQGSCFTIQLPRYRNNETEISNLLNEVKL
ncbi:sensor histidine kinase [Dictyobacter kobayashii]|uniref:histidine kinase n=1 Tax=Dictyobacter kobayashii TaxID=2014872 RepID=A0A402AGP7_9CHLR|nr:ATP-binding protein [Dictyobacter kobayashii]GCE18234.1 two-component sensor histidine kinase [Dictyobacter kobayashii]